MTTKKQKKIPRRKERVIYISKKNPQIINPRYLITEDLDLDVTKTDNNFQEKISANESLFYSFNDVTSNIFKRRRKK